MLVLSRKTNERIIFANGITLTIVAIKGKTVRIGINAPQDVLILREELLPRDHDTPSDRQDADDPQQ